MKAVLKAKGGFVRYTDLPDDTPIYEFVEPVETDMFSDNFDPMGTSTYVRKTFYRQRQFLNEFEEIVTVYEER